MWFKNVLFYFLKISTLEQSDNPQNVSKILGLVNGHNLLQIFYYEKFQIYRKNEEIITLNIHKPTARVQLL